MLAISIDRQSFVTLTNDIKDLINHRSYSIREQFNNKEFDLFLFLERDIGESFNYSDLLILAKFFLDPLNGYKNDNNINLAYKKSFTISENVVLNTHILTNIFGIDCSNNNEIMTNKEIDSLLPDTCESNEKIFSKEDLKIANSKKEAVTCVKCNGLLKSPYFNIKYCPNCEG